MIVISNLDNTCDGFLVLIGYMKKEFFRPAAMVTRSLLSQGQLHALGFLYKRGPLPMSVLAAEMKISKQHLTSLIGKLIDNDMVIRIKDEQDRRIVVIEITEVGKRSVEEVRIKVKKVITEKLAILPDEDLQELDNILNRLQEILKGIT